MNSIKYLFILLAIRITMPFIRPGDLFVYHEGLSLGLLDLQFETSRDGPVEPYTTPEKGCECAGGLMVMSLCLKSLLRRTGRHNFFRP